MTLKENSILYNYLKNNHQQTKALGTIVSWQVFGVKQYELIEELNLSDFNDLRGIEQLVNLKKVIIRDPRDFETLKKCPKLNEIDIELSENAQIDFNSLVELSHSKKLKIYGRGLKNISPEQALALSENTIISYYKEENLNVLQFSQVQQRLNEIASLIPNGASEFEKVKIIYENLLAKSFIYDKNNLSKDGNGYLINNTMYGPLVMNTGVCSGITLALDVALQNAGLQTNMCGGWYATKPTAGYGHQWNQVMIDGQWYNLDLTNDYDKEVWQFFLKSDDDPNWAKYHCFDKNDRSEVHQSCISSKYNGFSKNVHSEINNLLQQKEYLVQRKQYEELAREKELASLKLEEYRQNIIAWYDEYPDVRFVSDFQVYKNFENTEKCRHTLRMRREDGISEPVLEGEFLYDETFKTTLDVMVRDFAERNKPAPEEIKVSIDEENSNSLGNQSDVGSAKVEIKTENDNELNIDGVEKEVAWQYQDQIPQVTKEAEFKRTLHKKEDNGGFVKGIFIILGVIILGIILALFVIL